MLREVIRIVRVGGLVDIQVWALEQEHGAKRRSVELVRWPSVQTLSWTPIASRGPDELDGSHRFCGRLIQALLSLRSSSWPYLQCRFEEQDALVPWKMQAKYADPELLTQSSGATSTPTGEGG